MPNEVMLLTISSTHNDQPYPIILFLLVFDGVPLLAGAMVLVLLAIMKIYLPRRKTVGLISNSRL
ncbi:MAG: hypothetical protein LPK26_16560 [Bacillaceae bacterium]|nr:hypothetical protein [Bacillaceae bacterium]